MIESLYAIPLVILYYRLVLQLNCYKKKSVDFWINVPKPMMKKKRKMTELVVFIILYDRFLLQPSY